MHFFAHIGQLELRKYSPNNPPYLLCVLFRNHQTENKCVCRGWAIFPLFSSISSSMNSEHVQLRVRVISFSSRNWWCVHWPNHVRCDHITAMQNAHSFFFFGCDSIKYVFLRLQCFDLSMKKKMDQKCHKLEFLCSGRSEKTHRLRSHLARAKNLSAMHMWRWRCRNRCMALDTFKWLMEAHSHRKYSIADAISNMYVKVQWARNSFPLFVLPFEAHCFCVSAPFSFFSLLRLRIHLARWTLRDYGHESWTKRRQTKLLICGIRRNNPHG